MLVPAVKQRASNNLIMRLEMPEEGAGGIWGGGADAVLLPPACHQQLVEPVSCQPVSCLSPCFSLAPCRAAAQADGAGPASACHRHARGGCQGAPASAPLPATSPQPPPWGRDALPGAGWGHDWSTSCSPRCRRVAALASCLAELNALHPGMPSLCREGEREAGKLSQLRARWSLWGQDSRSAWAASPSIRQPGPCPRRRGHPAARQPAAVFWVPRVLGARSHRRD